MVNTTSGLDGRYLEFWWLTMSDNVDRVIAETSMAENIGAEVGIAARFLPV